MVLQLPSHRLKGFDDEPRIGGKLNGFGMHWQRRHLHLFGKYVHKS
jgi:hypothetical protein